MTLAIEGEAKRSATPSPVDNNLTVAEFTPIRDFKGSHILSAQQWDRDNLAVVHELTEQMRRLHKDKRGRLQLRKRLEGAEMFLGIYQRSSRTRQSFYAGMKRLGGIVYSEGSADSSRGKGEDLADTVTMMFEGGADLAVIRDEQTGYFKDLLPKVNKPIINAGDGEGEHPFQAAKDHEIMTGVWGDLNGLNITYGFEQTYSRVIHSNIRVMSLYDGVRMNFVSDPQLRPPEDLLQTLDQTGVDIHYFDNLKQAEEGGAFSGEKQAFYVTRLPSELLQKKVDDIVDPQQRAEMQEMVNWIQTMYERTSVDLDFIGRHPDLRLFHAMPVDRGNGKLGEIRRELNHHPQNMMIKQAGVGFYVSSALIQLVLQGY